MAVVALLRGYGPVTIRQAMALYAENRGKGKTILSSTPPFWRGAFTST